MNTEAIKKASEVFSALDVERNLMVLLSVANKEKYTTEIAQELGMSNSLVGVASRQLQQAGLITKRRKKQRVYLKAKDDVIVMTIIDLVKLIGRKRTA